MKEQAKAREMFGGLSECLKGVTPGVGYNMQGTDFYDFFPRDWANGQDLPRAALSPSVRLASKKAAPESLDITFFRKADGLGSVPGGQVVRLGTEALGLNREQLEKAPGKSRMVLVRTANHGCAIVTGLLFNGNVEYTLRAARTLCPRTENDSFEKMLASEAGVIYGKEELLAHPVDAEVLSAPRAGADKLLRSLAASFKRFQKNPDDEFMQELERLPREAVAPRCKPAQDSERKLQFARELKASVDRCWADAEARKLAIQPDSTADEKEFYNELNVARVELYNWVGRLEKDDPAMLRAACKTASALERFIAPVGSGPVSSVSGGVNGGGSGGEAPVVTPATGSGKKAAAPI